MPNPIDANVVLRSRFRDAAHRQTAETSTLPVLLCWAGMNCRTFQPGLACQTDAYRTPPMVTLDAICVPQPPAAVPDQLVKAMISSWLFGDQTSAVQSHQSLPATGADDVLYQKPAEFNCDSGVWGWTAVFG